MGPLTRQYVPLHWLVGCHPIQCTSSTTLTTVPLTWRHLGNIWRVEHVSGWSKGSRRSKHCTPGWRHTSTCIYLGVRVLGRAPAGGWKEVRFTSCCSKILEWWPMKVPYPSRANKTRASCTFPWKLREFNNMERPFSTWREILSYLKIFFVNIFVIVVIVQSVCIQFSDSKLHPILLGSRLGRQPRYVDKYSWGEVAGL